MKKKKLKKKIHKLESEIELLRTFVCLNFWNSRIKKSKEERFPIFVLSAKDRIAIEAINDYKNRCIENNCSDSFIIDIQKRINEFKKWRIENPDKIKLPD